MLAVRRIVPASAGPGVEGEQPPAKAPMSVKRTQLQRRVIGAIPGGDVCKRGYF
jgi:hypothetical protein